jgi:MFS transporter, DHA1 family, multidrug resistance protein
MEERNYRLKAPLFASLSLAFASFGDAFLYPFLPVNHAAVGVPVVWIGVLLSINRFVRILFNTWIVQLLAKYGLRLITILAVTLALLSTAGYAIASSLFLWLLLRVAWGLAFSALRITTIGYSLQQSQQGFALGLTRGVQEAGPMVALFLTPLLLQYFNVRHSFLILTALSLPALYFSWNLPTHHDKTSAVTGGNFLQAHSLVNSITFVSAFLIDGIIVVVLGILFLHYKESITLLTATSLAALYLGYRRVCLVLFSPAGGWLADRLGVKSIFNVSLAMMIAGLLILAFGFVETGAIMTFTFYSIHAAITPGYASWQQYHPLASVAVNATWRDIGAAMGTLAGGLLLSSTYLNHVLIFVIFGLAILFMFHWGTVQRALKFLYLWK